MITSPSKLFLISLYIDSSEAPQNSICEATSFLGFRSFAIKPNSIEEVLVLCIFDFVVILILDQTIQDHQISLFSL